MLDSALNVRQLGRQAYVPVWEAMSEFTTHRNEQIADELWLVEHDPVFTQGQAGKPEHLINPSNIPVVQVDRGGQVTYHGPGQQVVYCLIDLRRKKMGVRELVSCIEQAIVNLLSGYNISASARPDAPGVYVKSGAKICALGLRIRRGCSFHGLALNINLSMEPFSRINPCGYQGMQVTHVAAEGGPASLLQVQPELLNHLTTQLGYNRFQLLSELPTLLQSSKSP